MQTVSHSVAQWSQVSTEWTEGSQLVQCLDDFNQSKKLSRFVQVVELLRQSMLARVNAWYRSLSADERHELQALNANRLVYFSDASRQTILKDHVSAAIYNEDIASFTQRYRAILRDYTVLLGVQDSQTIIEWAQIQFKNALAAKMAGFTIQTFASTRMLGAEVERLQSIQHTQANNLPLETLLDAEFCIEVQDALR